LSSFRNYRSFTIDAPWYWIPPKGELRSLLLGLHGMAQEGERFGEKLSPLLDQGIGLILPSGPYPMEVRGRHGVRQGYAWYIFTGDQPGFMESMQRSEEDLLNLLLGIRQDAALSDLPLDLLGFSQGGYLAGFMALRHANLFRSCTIASARLKHEFVESELASSPQLQMLFLHDRKDPLTKAEPVEESQKILQRAGVNAVIQWHDEGHALGTQSVGLLAQWLKDISDQ